MLICVGGGRCVLCAARRSDRGPPHAIGERHAAGALRDGAARRHLDLWAATAPAAACAPELHACMGPGAWPSRSASSHASPAPSPSSGASVSVRVDGATEVHLQAGLALQADGSCLAASGSTHVLATVVCSSAEPSTEEFMPLQVRLYLPPPLSLSLNPPLSHPSSAHQECIIHLPPCLCIPLAPT